MVLPEKFVALAVVLLQPVYALSFFEPLPDPAAVRGVPKPQFFASVGSNRATVYKVREKGNATSGTRGPGNSVPVLIDLLLGLGAPEYILPAGEIQEKMLIG